MKVGLVCPYDLFSPGGVREHIFGLYRFFKREGLEVKLIAPRTERTADPDLLLIGRSVKVPSGTGSWSRLSLPFGEGRIREILVEERFDLLHFHEPLVPFLSWSLLLSSKAVNIATFHSAWENNISLISNFFFLLAPFASMFSRKLSGLIAVSQVSRNCWQRFFSEKIEVIPNGIDLQRFGGGERRRGREVEILFVGRIEKRKGLIYLLRALKEIEEENWSLTVVGSGPRSAEAKGFVRFAGLRERVRFLGRVGEGELPRIYQKADIACFPSIGGESFGIVLLEAMASSLPIVCFRNPGYFEILKNYPRSKCLVEVGDVLGLASALKELIRRPSLRAELGRWGRKEVEKYSWEKVGRRVLDYYLHLLERRRKNSKTGGRNIDLR